MDNTKLNKSCYTHIIAKIDNKSPHFKTCFYFKDHNLQKDSKRVVQIDKENMKLLKKINIIHRLGGYVDCWALNFNYKSRFKNQNRKNEIIMQKNKIILKKIRQAESQYATHKILADWEKMQKSFHLARYSSLIKTLPVLLNIKKELSEKCQTKCFFDIGLKEENQKLGRMVFGLYDNIVPRTTANFAAFCRGINGMSYKNTPFHRIVSGYWCEGGDVTKFDGTGGTSIYGDSFEKENSYLNHIGPGILSTCNNDDGKSNSKFNLTFKRLRTVNKDKIVFGRIIKGMSNIYKIEEFGTKTGKPIKSVIVLNCGVLSKKNEKLFKF